MLAIASRYTSLEQVRTDTRDVNTAGLGFLQQAEALLQVDLKWPSITTIQSLATMAIMYVAIGSDASGWLHHGMAIRLVLDMGLNLASSAPGSSSLTAEDIQLRHQVYWSLYCSDKLWATYTGRVCTMLDYQGSVPLPNTVLPVTGSPISILRELSTHCIILEKILTTLYAPNKTALDAEKYSFFDLCLMTLRGWFHSLPNHVGLNTGEQQPNPQTSPHVHILHMVYHTSIILLCKPFITNKRFGESDTAPELHNATASDVRRRASTLCREAAREICLITERCRETFGSFRQSPLTATHCTLMAILVTLHGEDSHTDTSRGARKGLKTAMKTLEELSDSWTPPRRYWHTMTQALRISSLSIENQDEAQDWQESRAPDAAASQHEQRDSQQEIPLRLDSEGTWVNPELQLASDHGAQHPTYFNIDELELTAFDQLPSDYLTLESLGFDFSFSI
ncbi:hypothetical protein CEP54_008553 [Fusarium duplospermum]|uniref:Xylanolytic transcriptional activator regulatory domain-containing protein n=1 Tax=Fusarium duplospermum TaxID=1325734 RepID=A0A428PV80_9HYPO|nr:hypothetical protein CEP54_008553 [Fusarium duplospermum]